MIRRNFLPLAVGVAVILACAASDYAQQPQNFDNVEIHVLPVQGNVYMLVGAGGNITMQVGKEGVLLVDTMYAQLSDKIIAAIRTVSDKPIHYIIDTHVHGDHTGGNEKLAKAGSTITGGNVVGDIGASAGEGATVIATQQVLDRMSRKDGNTPAFPSAAWPTDAYITDVKELFFDGEAIQIFHQPAAHTDGDSIVFFRRSDVVSTGDIFVTTSYPIIDLDRGGTYQGVLDGLNHILDITIPADKEEGGTYVIPGHGRLCDEADVVEYRDMMTILRDRFLDMIKRGMTLEQVKAAKPTRDYDPLYGSDKGFWTTDKFIETAYKSLKAGK
ncbi:MAG TPA: MBL fold metallo-hydrolase [Bryobacteraceae bacterium]|jgi:glyoxylase-like metal-dependent hydrolase (beta-lactamase superfamily II)|nr:MBL fold metallo-hydrolase [Bryobacteraceae bacterium]